MFSIITFLFRVIINLFNSKKELIIQICLHSEKQIMRIFLLKVQRLKKIREELVSKLRDTFCLLFT